MIWTTFIADSPATIMSTLPGGTPSANTAEVQHTYLPVKLPDPGAWHIEIPQSAPGPVYQSSCRQAIFTGRPRAAIGNIQ
jgi:hypothetical protein